MRSELKDLCESLDHDPGRVARIVIEPDKVVVEYHHQIMSDQPDLTED